MATVSTEYEVVIGMEVHAQLLTESKMFCPCRTDFSPTEPNTRVCPVCLGMPGVLPVINRRAVEYTIMTGLALNCTIPELSKFDRKNYPYPDLMKGYQISQYDLPLCKGGRLEIEAEGITKRVDVNRVHLEEDTARLLHRVNEAGQTYSLVDVNRSGVPLMEIVSEPDLRSAEEARAYLTRLRQILQYLGVSAANMEEGNFRCEPNVSLRPRGATQLGNKVELKNINSFRAVFRAIVYEVERQRQVLEGGGRVVQETRGWDEAAGRTVSQRSKEYAHDYRYFPEPDLPPLAISRQWVEELRARLPELPHTRQRRLVEAYGLSAYEANLLTESRARADYFEAALADVCSDPERLRRRSKGVANWMLGDFAHALYEAGLETDQSRISPDHLAALVDMVDGRAITSPIAKAVFQEMFASGKPPAQVVRERGLTEMGNEGELAAVVEQVLAAQPQAVADYRKGKGTALRFLMGQVMRETRGRANPQLAEGLLREKLGPLPER